MGRCLALIARVELYYVYCVIGMSVFVFMVTIAVMAYFLFLKVLLVNFSSPTQATDSSIALLLYLSL